MQPHRAPLPPYPERSTIALLGKRIHFKNIIGNLILNDPSYFDSKSDDSPLARRENVSFSVINTPDFFDAECPNPDQRFIDFMALSHPGLDLYILVVDPENAQVEKVVGQITKLQKVFGEQITNHLVVMCPDLQSLQALAHLKETCYVRSVAPPDNLPSECRRWCRMGRSFVYEYNDYSQGVVLGRKAAIEKSSTRNEGKFLSEPKYESIIFKHTDGTSQATLQHNSATAPPISTSVLAVPDHRFNIILLGLTGTGKSSSANTILKTGSSKEISPFRSEASSIPITSQCESRFMTKPFGIPVRLVDTPDFFHEDLINPEAHIEECRKYCQRGHCVVLLVLQLGRFTDGEREILPELERRMGWKIREETILLLTHGDDLRGDLDKHVQTHPQLKSIADMCGSRYHAFNNKILNNKQVIDLVKKIPHYKKRFPMIAKKDEGGCQLS